MARASRYRRVTPEEADHLPLRADQLPALFRYVAQGGPVYPLSLLTLEGAPYLAETGDEKGIP